MRSVKNARRNHKISTWKNRPKRKNNARKKADKAKQWQRNSGRERRQILETEGKREEGQHKKKKRIRTEKEEEETMRAGKASAKVGGNGNNEKCMTAEALKNVQVNQKHEKEKSVGRKGENGQKREETEEKEKEKGKKETIEMEKKENCAELANLDEKKEERKGGKGEEKQQQKKKRVEEKGQTKHLMENGVGGEKGKGAAEKESNTDQKTKREGGYGGGDTVETDRLQTQQNGGETITQFVRDVHKLANSVDEIQRMATPLNPIKIEPLRLERITRQTTERKPREHKLLETDIQYCEHMISKHGDDYEAMSRDPTNAVGDAPTAIQRKLRIYRDFMKHQQQNEASA
ncbi:hypothetical protein niasHS_010621 [Heterodera schachtii]|uniref:Nucleolar protein 16 n=2 Tax=Heterodera TaxID=34509 RepID=A0ABD2IS38_HETSC